MLFRATKDTYEREEDEASRLVRPAPKVKPPRKDKRREVTHADKDPDVSQDKDLKSDPDMSLNYKTIGGSTSSRVVARFLFEAASKIRTRNPKPGGKPKPSAGPKKYVTVFDRDTQETRTVLESQQKKNPSRYQVVKPGEKPEEQAPSEPSGSEPVPAPSPRKEKTPIRPGAPSEKPQREDTSGAPASPKSQGDDPQVQQRLKDLEQKGSKDALLKYVGDLPTSETSEDGKVQVFDPSTKKSVPLEQLSSKGWSTLLDKFEKKQRDDATRGALDTLASDPKMGEILKDLAFLGGATKEKGEEEGPLARRVREMQKEGYPLEALPISKTIPELKGVSLPEGVRTLADLIPAAAARRKKPDESSKGADSDQAERVVERFKAERLKTPEFLDYAKELNDSDEGPDGNPRFLDKAKKKMVPFEDLPSTTQKAIVDKFEAQQKEKAKIQAMANIAKDPKHLDALVQVADVASDPSSTDGALTKRIRALKEQGLDLSDLPIGKHIPELQGVDFPENIVSVADLVDAAQVVRKPKLKRPDVSPEEKQETEGLVRILFGYGDVSESVLKLHPIDQKAMVDHAMDALRAARKSGGKVEGDFQLDPNRISPPKTVTLKDGKEVPFDSLSPDEQLEAWQDHKNKTLAISLIQQKTTQDKLNRQGVPEPLSYDISHSIGRGLPPKAVFYSALINVSADPPESEKKIRRVLQSVPDEHRPQVAAYYQGKDYQDVKGRYFGYGDDIVLYPNRYPDAIHEHLSSKDILKKMTKAMGEIRDRQKVYPEDTRLDLSKQFRDRTLSLFESSHRQGRVPQDKLDAIRSFVDQQDADDYDDALAKWKKQKRQGPEPVKPERYDEVRGAVPKRKTVFDRLKGLWSPQRTASHDLSTCSPWKVMRSKSLHDRSAVYWGVAPYPEDHEGFAPYNEWEQVHARDLGEADLSLLLNAAREWLEQPILDLATMDPQVPDARFRAALDFAIQTTEGGKYGVGLHPALYNRLLARLMGQPEDETLLTLRKEAGESLYAFDPNRVRPFRSHQDYRRNRPTAGEMPMIPKFSSQDADRVLARLDRLAATVQAKYASWGMPFEAAKEIVNALDKTADEIESASFGRESLARRQAEVMGKSAKVIQRDADEAYMDHFKNPMAPVQIEADEPYMKLYSDDQSSAVGSGESMSGRKLAPEY